MDLSVALETELIAHPDVLEAAVIAKPDKRWTERPLACVVLRPEADASAEDLREHLAARVAKWWLPGEFAFIDEVPKTGTGKFDKKAPAPAAGRRRAAVLSVRGDPAPVPPLTRAAWRVRW